jgi:1,4-dihydroxy-2-naphthoate octaprenyltransferase
MFESKKHVWFKYAVIYSLLFIFIAHITYLQALSLFPIALIDSFFGGGIFVKGGPFYYSLTIIGYVFTIIFWGVVGALIGKYKEKLFGKLL